MTSPLLETKLYVPRRHGGLVARPRLAERLCRGIDAKLWSQRRTQPVTPSAAATLSDPATIA